MEKIIVNPADQSAVEVFHNNSIQFRMGSGSEEYKSLCEKEAKIAHKFLDIALTGKLPKLAETALELRKDVSAERINDIQVVFQKVSCLMAQGFHGKVIISMLRCATGGGCDFSNDFQMKFEKAMNQEVRKDFWGTEYRFPLVVAEDLLVDMLEKDIDVDSPTEEDFAKSIFYKEFVTDHS